MAGNRERASDLAAMMAPESKSDTYYRIAIALRNNGDLEAADAPPPLPSPPPNRMPANPAYFTCFSISRSSSAGTGRRGG